MNRCVVQSLLIAALTCATGVRALGEEPAKDPQDRIEELERELQSMKTENSRLRNRLAKLEKSVKSSDADDSAAADKPDPAKLFPLHSKWNGQYRQEGEAAARSVSAEVIEQEGDYVLLKLQVMGHAIRHYHLKVDGERVTITRNEGMGKVPGTSFPANQINAKGVKGKISGRDLIFKGMSVVNGADGKPVGRFNIRMNLRRDR